MKPALIIGSTCVDVIINLPHLPVSQEDVHPTAQTMALGGCPYNVASIVRLLDVPCTHISPIGTGMYGDYVAKCYEEAGLPITVRVHDRENGCCYCLVEESGERTFMAYHGAEYMFSKEWMRSYDSNDYGIVYVCGIDVEEPTGMEIVEYLEENPNLNIFFAPGPRLKHLTKEKIDRMMALRPILHLNELEALTLSGMESIEDAAKSLHERTGNAVILTLGAKGTYCMESDGTTYTIPSIPAEHVVDTIGAGNSHAGSVIACLTKGMSLHDSIAYANRVAAAIVGVKGLALKREDLPTL